MDNKIKTTGNIISERSSRLKGEERAELRSEKVRSIIGQVPPILLRYGVMIIVVTLLILIGVTAFIPYQPSIDVEIVVTQTNDNQLCYTARIPLSAMKNKDRFRGVNINSSSELPLPERFKIDSILDVVELSEQDAWYLATLSPIDKLSGSILLNKPIIVSGKILLKKQSVMMWMVHKR